MSFPIVARPIRQGLRSARFYLQWPYVITASLRAIINENCFTLRHTPSNCKKQRSERENDLQTISLKGVVAEKHWVNESTNLVLRGSNVFVTGLEQDNSSGLGITIVLPYIDVANNRLQNPTEFTKDIKAKNTTFKDYLEKFQPGNVWQKINNKNKIKGINKTVGDEFDEMFNGIDPTDELLKLKVQNGAPKMVFQKDGRRQWRPDGDWGWYYDRYYLKRRFFELSKQAIYQTRYKMVIMQNLREKYRNVSVYKMGFLMSKTDNACKTFNKLAFKAAKDCSTARQGYFPKMTVIELLTVTERLINLWFQNDLLIELVIKNHENCKRMLEHILNNRKTAWKFVD